MKYIFKQRDDVRRVDEQRRVGIRKPAQMSPFGVPLNAIKPLLP